MISNGVLRCSKRVFSVFDEPRGSGWMLKGTAFQAISPLRAAAVKFCSSAVLGQRKGGSKGLSRLRARQLEPRGSLEPKKSTENHGKSMENP